MTTLSDGCCQCGCGKLAPIATKSNPKRGYRRGDPKHFIYGHSLLIAGTKGATTHGMSKTPAYVCYSSAKSRCNNPHNKHYADYGGRGIKFRFNTFQEFYACVGPRPVGMSLDRIDVDGDYCLGNLRWADLITQANNRRPRRVARFADYVPAGEFSEDRFNPSQLPETLVQSNGTVEPSGLNRTPFHPF